MVVKTPVLELYDNILDIDAPFIDTSALNHVASQSEPPPLVEALAKLTLVGIIKKLEFVLKFLYPEYPVNVKLFPSVPKYIGLLSTLPFA